MRVKAMQLVSTFTFLVISSCALAQQTRQIGSGSLPGPGTCPAGATCKTGTGTMNTDPAGVPSSNSGDRSDPVLQRIWAVAQQLGLTSDQRSDLRTALKSQNNERADIDKLVQDARSALANALANGQTLLDSEIENLASANAKAQESQLKLWAKLYALLTPDQQRRLLSLSTPLSLATAIHGTVQGQ